MDHLSSVVRKVSGLALSLLWFLAAQRVSGQVGLRPLGEFKVNTYTTSTQSGGAVAGNATGDFVVAWSSNGQDGSGFGVYAQRYDVAGSPVGGEFRVNTTTNGAQEAPSVAMAADGRFIIAWQSAGQDGSGFGIYAQKYDAAGGRVGSEFKVNTDTLQNQTEPSIAMAPDGRFVVAWRVSDLSTAILAKGLRVQRYTADWLPVGGEISPFGLTRDDMSLPAVAMAEDGSFAVAAQITFAGDKEIFLRLYEADGTPRTAEINANSIHAGAQDEPSLAMQPDGVVFLAWDTSDTAEMTREIAGRRFDASGNPLGDEFAINDFTAGVQSRAAVRSDRQGRCTVVWRSDNFDGSGNAVSAQRFGADGSRLGGELHVNTLTTGSQVNSGAPVVADGAGNLAFVWTSADQDGSGTGIYADKFFLPGNPMPLAEIRVNSSTLDDQTRSASAMNASGDAVVVWRDAVRDGSSGGIFGQRYGADGQRVGSQFAVNTTTTGDQSNPMAAIDADGDFVVVWQSAGQDGDGWGIYGRRFDRNGVPLAGEFRVNTSSTNDQEEPAVAMNPAGQFVVVWQNQGSTLGIHARRYDASGTALGSSFTVNTETSGDQSLPSVAMHVDGSFVVAWETVDTGTSGVRAQRFNSAGTKLGAEMTVPSTTSFDETAANVATTPDGGFICAWQSSAKDGSGSGIFARRFNAAGAAIASEFPVNTFTSGAQIYPMVAVDAVGNFMVAWNSEGQDLSGYGVYAQRFLASGVKNGAELRLNQQTTGEQRWNKVGRTLAVDEGGNYLASWHSQNQDGSGWGIYATRAFVASPPIAVTQAATGVGFTTATLRGTIDPNNAVTTGRFEYGTSPSYGSTIGTTPAPGSGSDPVTVSAELSGLAANTTYHYRLVAESEQGTSAGANLMFTTGALAPTVATGTATAVTNTGATIGGTVNPNGSLVTSAVVEYGTTTSYGMSANVAPAPGAGTAAVSVSATLTGLLPNQFYHFRVTATNAAGPASGLDGTFRTGATPPAVTTGGTSNLAATSVNVGGTVNPNGSATTALFQYGLDTSYGSTMSVQTPPGSGTAPVAVSAQLGGLKPNRLYHYRLTANNDGGTVAGADATFTTPALPPTVQTLPESDVTTGGATLRATVNPNGAATTVKFTYGLPGTFTQQTTTVAVGDGTEALLVVAEVTGLASSTDYEYRVEASNAGGPTVGSAEAFRTALQPLVVTDDVRFVGQTEISINALENDEGDGLQIIGLLDQPGATAFDPSRVFTVSPNTTITFRPKAEQVVNLGDPRERFRYRVQDLGLNEAQAEVSVWYFLGLRGTYFGTFPVAGTTPRALSVRLELNFAGQATGRLEWEGEQYPFSVQVDGHGRLRVVRAKKGAGADGQLVLDLALLPLSPEQHTLEGSFSDGSSSASVSRFVTLQFIPLDLEATPAKGLQVAFIDPGEAIGGPPLNDLVEAPEGVGFVRLKIGSRAQAKFITKMPDFSTFSAGKRLLLPDAVTPQARYKLQQVVKVGRRKVGTVKGTVFTGREGPAAVDRVLSLLDWERPATAAGTSGLFTGGFHVSALLSGFRYLHPGGKVPAGFATGQNANADVRLAGGGLAAPLSFPAYLDAATGAAGQGADPTALALGFTAKFKFGQGTFTGAFNHPTTGQRVRFIGGISSFEKRCRGVFLVPKLQNGDSRSGRIEITPRAAP
jgi:phosphodiesterase/alkaline phosphatase D-like protein